MLVGVTVGPVADGVAVNNVGVAEFVTFACNDVVGLGDHVADSDEDAVSDGVDGPVRVAVRVPDPVDEGDFVTLNVDSPELVRVTVAAGDDVFDGVTALDCVKVGVPVLFGEFDGAFDGLLGPVADCVEVRVSDAVLDDDGVLEGVRVLVALLLGVCDDVGVFDGV